jgi:hypothetical protein
MFRFVEGWMVGGGLVGCIRKGKERTIQNDKNESKKERGKRKCNCNTVHVPTWRGMAADVQGVYDVDLARERKRERQEGSIGHGASMAGVLTYIHICYG